MNFLTHSAQFKRFIHIKKKKMFIVWFFIEKVCHSCHMQLSYLELV